MNAPVDIQRWRRLVRAVGMGKRPARRPKLVVESLVGGSHEVLPTVAEVAAAVRAPPPAPVLPPKTGLGTCPERDASTGKKCSLPARHEGEHSASGLKFRLCLRPGDPLPARLLDERARARGESIITAGGA